VLEKVAGLKDYTTICASGPSELLAEVALRHAAELAQRSRRIIDVNLSLLNAFFSRHSEEFAWARPSAGPVAFPRYLKGDVGDFCKKLLEERGVLLAPGVMFGDTGNRFRVGFGRAGMHTALNELERFVSRA
jgi:aspartate/methionine/tyrosine aminotransferase